MLRLKEVHAMKRPPERNQTSLYNMIDKTECVVDSETEWIHQGPDLAAVAHDHEYGWFQNKLEDTLNVLSRRATRVSCISSIPFSESDSLSPLAAAEVYLHVILAGNLSHPRAKDRNGQRGGSASSTPSPRSLSTRRHHRSRSCAPSPASVAPL